MFGHALVPYPSPGDKTEVAKDPLPHFNKVNTLRGSPQSLSYCKCVIKSMSLLPIHLGISDHCTDPNRGEYLTKFFLKLSPYLGYSETICPAQPEYRKTVHQNFQTVS